MMSDSAGGPTRSAAGSPKKGGAALKDSGQEAPNVEPYQLPRWDAQGKPVPEPRANQSDTSSVEDVHPDSLKPPTADEIRQIHEDAYNEGFESGFEQGMKQGQATGQAEGYKAGYDSGEQEGLSAGNKAGMQAAQEAEAERINAELAPLSELLDQIKQVLGQQTEAVESGLVALATRIARNVIDAELMLNPDHIESLVHAAVQALPNADERFTLEVNPEDAAYVERIAEPHWNLVPTPSVSRGGCVIRTRFSYVDYSLEHRYRQQISNLLAHAGLSEHLKPMEAPWPLPAAEPKPETEPTDAQAAVSQEAEEGTQEASEETLQSVEDTQESSEETPQPAENNSDLEEHSLPQEAQSQDETAEAETEEQRADPEDESGDFGESEDDKKPGPDRTANADGNDE